MPQSAASAFVDALYFHCLKREADPAGREFFTGLITNERWSFERVACAFADSVEYRGINALRSPVRSHPAEPLPRLCFIHIEKTAGTSFHDYLLEIYPEHLVFPERLHRLEQYSTDDFMQYRLYSGHYSLAQCTDMPRDTQFVTFLRNPQERILSLYYFWRSVQSGFDAEQVWVAKRCGLAEFLRHPVVQSSIHNVQQERLVSYGSSTARLDQFRLVGVKELYSLCVIMLACNMGWPLPSHLYERLGPKELGTHPNHRPVEREPLTSEILELLHQRTCGDNVVYEYALERFASDFRKIFGFDFPPEQLPHVAERASR